MRRERTGLRAYTLSTVSITVQLRYNYIVIVNIGRKIRSVDGYALCLERYVISGKVSVINLILRRGIILRDLPGLKNQVEMLLSK